MPWASGDASEDRQHRDCGLPPIPVLHDLSNSKLISSPQIAGISKLISVNFEGEGVY